MRRRRGASCKEGVSSGGGGGVHRHGLYSSMINYNLDALFGGSSSRWAG